MYMVSEENRGSYFISNNGDAKSKTVKTKQDKRLE